MFHIRNRTRRTKGWGRIRLGGVIFLAIGVAMCLFNGGTAPVSANDANSTSSDGQTTVNAELAAKLNQVDTAEVVARAREAITNELAASSATSTFDVASMSSEQATALATVNEGTARLDKLTQASQLANWVDLQNLYGAIRGAVNAGIPPESIQLQVPIIAIASNFTLALTDFVRANVYFGNINPDLAAVSVSDIGDWINRIVAVLLATLVALGTACARGPRSQEDLQASGTYRNWPQWFLQEMRLNDYAWMLFCAGAVGSILAAAAIKLAEYLVGPIFKYGGQYTPWDAYGVWLGQGLSPQPDSINVLRIPSEWTLGISCANGGWGCANGG